jgi:hypothetical protein
MEVTLQHLQLNVKQTQRAFWNVLRPQLEYLVETMLNWREKAALALCEPCSKETALNAATVDSSIASAIIPSIISTTSVSTRKKAPTARHPTDIQKIPFRINPVVLANKYIIVTSFQF